MLMASESKTKRLYIFFTKWIRGIRQLSDIVQWGFAILVVLFLLALMESLFVWLLTPFGESAQMLAGPISYFVMLVLAILFIPYYLGQSNLNVFSVREDANQEIEFVVDTLAKKHGLRWESTVFGEVDQLVRSGKKVEAARALRNTDNDMSLANSMQVIADWDAKRLRKKLELLAGHTPQEPKPA